MKKSVAMPKRFYMLTAAALVWMVFIFIKSAETYQEQSLRPVLSEWLAGANWAEWLPRLEFRYDDSLVSYQDPYGLIEFFIRKAGHVTEYFILTALWAAALLTKPVKLIPALLASALISLLYAASDEWHQTFVPNRTGHAIDVWIDLIGIVLAALLAAGWRRRRSRRGREAL